MQLADLVRRHAADRPEHPALRWETGEWTWAELDARSSRVAQALRGSGVEPGDRVAWLDKNGPEHTELQYAAAKLGAVFTPLNFRLAAGEVREIVADCRASVWVVGAEFAELAERVAAELDRPIELVIVDSTVEGTSEGVPGGPLDGAVDGPEGRRDYREWVAAAGTEDPGHRAADDDVVLQLYSSGTTGRAKGIELTHRNLAACVGVYDELMGIDAPDAVCLAPLPLFHVGGLTWALAGHRFGTTVVLMRDPVPGRVLDILEHQRITHAGFVPALMQALLAVPGVAERDYRALRAILYGASPITETLLARLVGVFGCRFFQAYGSTETTAAVVILPAADHDPDGPNRHRLRACGLPLPGVSVRVVDPATGEDVADGETGEFWIKAPNVMRGYFDQPELTAEVLTDGWFHSGDVGYRDPDGYLFLRDRTKDVIISGAENIYPTEVENALAGHPAVADCAVIGVPSERWGETPKAIVVRTGGASVDAEALIEHCRARLARYKCPSSVDFVDELPRNPSGKILKKQLRAPFWADRDRSI